MEKTLLEEITALRDRLRQEGAAEGKTPQVCSDAALAELSRLKPKTKEELLYVKGLGKSFAEKYGERFLEILKRETASAVKSSLLCPEVRATLKNLENRLVNINKRNRLLYMPKISRGTSYDLLKTGNASAETFNARLTEFLRRFEPNKRFMLCDIQDGEEALKQHKLLTGVMRESARSLRESGENSLYIAYPFCIGKLPGEDFVVRAPLVLFPVEVIRDNSTAVVKMDTTKDVLFNSSLILSHKKFSGDQGPLPSPVFEDPHPYRFFDQITAYYGAAGLALKKRDIYPKPFAEYTQSSFPKFRGGELYIEECAVLGKFPTYSSALQKDFQAIRESDKINGLLNSLLERVEDVDFYSDSVEFTESPAPVPGRRERDLNYINDLNISQESAIFAVSEGEKLVIQGPPGTGKSQVITSLIADSVLKGKNVLMVSQKKAALDVIYSRLGKSNPYALFIPDMKDKESFYAQMYRLLNLPAETGSDPEWMLTLSDKIDSLLTRLDRFADDMYYDAAFGEPIYKIYEENLNSAAKPDDRVAKAFWEICPKEFFEIGYDNLKKLRSYFSDSYLLNSLAQYFVLNEKYPWLHLVKEGFTQFQINGLLKEIDKLIDGYGVVQSYPKTFRVFLGRKFKRPLKVFLKRNFAKFSRRELKKFLDDPVQLYNGFEAYLSFYSEKTKYDELSERQKLFIENIYAVSTLAERKFKDVLSLSPEYAALRYIEFFEAGHRDALASLDSHHLTVRDIAVYMEQKKTVCKTALREMLANAAKENIADSKRAGDILRVIDGKRKWDIARFIHKFNFELFKGVKIFLMTPEVVSEVLPLENGLFDLVIFDEASQIYIEKGVPSIARAKKVVIAGDHKQLRPSSLGFGRFDYDDEAAENADADLNAALEEESLLDLARFKYPEVMLDYHYRSRYEELIAFSNYAFYKGRLNVSPNTEKPAEPPIKFLYVEGGLWQDRVNKAEAVRVVELLKDILSSRKNRETLGVITFNSQQRDYILDLIDAEAGRDPAFAAAYAAEAGRQENGEDIGLFIKNIENVQGDERDIIIFSLAYAKNESGKVVRNFGWLNQAGGENRLNVAISRAKRKIIVVSSIYPNELKVDDLQNEGPRIFKKYLEYAHFISEGNPAAAKEILYSFGSYGVHTSEYYDEFVLEVARELLKHGLEIERNVGMGGYKIDMAVKDSGGKYLLGIDCDCNLYRMIRSSRERDVHRLKYLSARGWKLHRIWSGDFWRDKEKEIEKIKAELY